MCDRVPDIFDELLGFPLPATNGVDLDGPYGLFLGLGTAGLSGSDPLQSPGDASVPIDLGELLTIDHKPDSPLIRDLLTTVRSPQPEAVIPRLPVQQSLSSILAECGAFPPGHQPPPLPRDLDDLCESIRQAARASQALDSTQLDKPVKPKRKRRKPQPAIVRPLTDRQTEVYLVFNECNGNFAEAARRLGIDRKSVEQHVKAVRKKLNIPDVKHLRPRSIRRDRRAQEDLSYEDDRRE